MTQSTAQQSQRRAQRASWGTRRVIGALQVEMRKAGLSLERVAREAGLSVGGLEYVFSLQSEPKASTLERLVQAVERLAAAGPHRCAKRDAQSGRGKP